MLGLGSSLATDRHVYGQLRRELALHAPGTAKYIVMHDTTSFERQGTRDCTWPLQPYDLQAGCPARSPLSGMESPELDVKHMMHATGFSEHDIRTGLWPAVEEFLRRADGEWRLARRWHNNNGLTLLVRRGVDDGFDWGTL